MNWLCGVRISVGTRDFLSSPKGPDRLWGPPSLIQYVLFPFLKVKWPTCCLWWWSVTSI